MNVHNHSIWPPPITANLNSRHMLLPPARAGQRNVSDKA